VLKGNGRILDPWVGRFNMGRGHEFCVPGSRICRDIWVADFARFSELELA
jgi:hypothetical protein